MSKTHVSLRRWLLSSVPANTIRLFLWIKAECPARGQGFWPYTLIFVHLNVSKVYLISSFDLTPSSYPPNKIIESSNKLQVWSSLFPGMSSLYLATSHLLPKISYLYISEFDVPFYLIPPTKYAELLYTTAVWWAKAPGLFLD